MKATAEAPAAQTAVCVSYLVTQALNQRLWSMGQAPPRQGTLPQGSRGLSGFWSLDLREERLGSNSVCFFSGLFRSSGSGEKGVLGWAGGRMWRWRVEKQGMSCKALKIWAGGRHDAKDVRKGGQSHSCPLTAPCLATQLNATGNKAIFRKPSTVPSKSQTSPSRHTKY